MMFDLPRSFAAYRGMHVSRRWIEELRPGLALGDWWSRDLGMALRYYKHGPRLILFGEPNYGVVIDDPVKVLLTVNIERDQVDVDRTVRLHAPAGEGEFEFEFTPVVLKKPAVVTLEKVVVDGTALPSVPGGAFVVGVHRAVDLWPKEVRL